MNLESTIAILIFLLFAAFIYYGIFIGPELKQKRRRAFYQALENRKWIDAQKALSGIARDYPEIDLLAAYIEARLGNQAQALNILTQFKQKNPDWAELCHLDEAIQALTPNAPWPHEPEAYAQKAHELYLQSSGSLDEENEDKALAQENAYYAKALDYTLMECALAARAPQLKRRLVASPLWGEETDDHLFSWVVPLHHSVL